MDNQELLLKILKEKEQFFDNNTTQKKEFKFNKKIRTNIRAKLNLFDKIKILAGGKIVASSTVRTEKDPGKTENDHASLTVETPTVFWVIINIFLWIVFPMITNIILITLISKLF